MPHKNLYTYKYMTQEHFERMNSVLVTAIQFLLENKLKPFLSGSFALCAYAGRLVGDPQDIDFLFESREEHDRAVSLLEDKLHFKRKKQISWESDTEDESVNTKLTSPEGIEFDLAFTIGDIQLSFDPGRTIKIMGFTIPIISLEDIRKSYQRFFDEKPDSQLKINLIDRLIVL